MKAIPRPFNGLPLLVLPFILAGCAGTAGRNSDPTVTLQNAAPAALTATPVAEMVGRQAAEIPLSPGDRLRVLVDDGAPFSGIFQVDVDGQLHIPYLPPLPAAGSTINALQSTLAAALVAEGMFHPEYVRVSVNILQWAPVQISVAGAVFQPGRVLLNDLQGSKAKDAHLQIAQESGDYPVQRFLSYALKGASGVMPTADLKHVQLIRKAGVTEFDLSGIFSGKPVDDVPLIAGDQVVVPNLGRIQPEYIRPSQITPPGFEVFFSNLAEPVSGHTSTVQRQERSVPYGSKLSLGLIAANCVGGAELTNAGRDALLVSKNILTGQPESKRYSVPEVMAHVDDPELNPYLMPYDSIACYDSAVVNAREAMKTLSDFISPFVMLMLLL